MVEIDALDKTSRQINVEIKEAAKTNSSIRVVNPSAKHHLGVGVLKSVEITYEGSVGYFCTALTDGCDVVINGSAGWCLGDNMMSGKVVVNGRGGSSVGPALRGGTIVVRGDVGNRLGQVMKDGLIVVEGNAGFMAGFMMIGGKIIVLGDMGENVGHWIISGEIFVGGKVKSLGSDAVQEEINDNDARYLHSTLTQLDVDPAQPFKKIVSKKELHHYLRREK